MSASSSRANRADAREAGGSRDKFPKSSARDPLVEEFLRYLTNEQNASPRTLKAYRHALTSFREKSKTAWKKCTADDFRNYLFVLMKRGQARSYVRLEFSALRTFYQFLTARKRLRHNPVREVQLPKMEKKLPLVLTRLQVDELLTAPTREPKSRSVGIWKKSKLPHGGLRQARYFGGRPVFDWPGGVVQHPSHWEGDGFSAPGGRRENYIGGGAGDSHGRRSTSVIVGKSWRASGRPHRGA